MVFASREQLQKIIALIDELDELLLDVSEIGHSEDFKQFTLPIRQAAYKTLKYYESRLTPVGVDAALPPSSAGQE